MGSSDGIKHFIDLTGSDGEIIEAQNSRVAQNLPKQDAKTMPRDSGINSGPSGITWQVRPVGPSNGGNLGGMAERPRESIIQDAHRAALNQSKATAAANRLSKTPISFLARDQHGRFESTDSSKRSKSPAQFTPAEAPSKPVTERLKKRAPEPQFGSRLAIVTKKKDPPRHAPMYGSPYAPIASTKPTSNTAQPSAQGSPGIDGRDRNLGTFQKSLNVNRPLPTQVLHPARHGIGNGEDSLILMTSPRKSSTSQGNRDNGATGSPRASLESSNNFAPLLRSLISGNPKMIHRNAQMQVRTDGEGSTQIVSRKEAPEFKTVPEVRPILQKQVDAFVIDHQYFLKSWLRRIRTRASREAASKEGGDVSPPSSKKSRSGFEKMNNIGAPQKGKPGIPEGFVPNNDTSFHVGLRTPASTHPKIVPVTVYSASPVKIPLYTSHTTLKQNILAENVKKLAVWPHLVDEDNAEQDLYPELKERYSHGNPDNRMGTLHLREKNKQLGPFVKNFLEELGCTIDDALRAFLDRAGILIPSSERNDILNVIGIEDDQKNPPLKRKWALALSELPEISEQRQQNIRLACEAASSSEKLSLWQFTKHFHDKEKAGSCTTKSSREHSITVYKNLECQVCHVHDCDLHGEIKERIVLNDQDDDDIPAEISSDEDDSANINNKIRVVPHSNSHKPGAGRFAYNVSDGGYDSGAYAGRNIDGTISGSCTVTPGLDPTFDDDQLCSESCFWKKSDREKLRSLSPWTSEEMRVFDGLLAACGHHKRGPCMIATIMDKPCVEVFIRVLARSSADQSTPQTERPKKVTVKKKAVENSIIHNREPFIPCSHAGSCRQAKCRCFTQGTHCEKTCTCSPTCDRRFKGCTCARIGMICWQNRKCLCFLMNRECDEDLCKTCGADEVLDPANRHKPEITTGHCTNVGIQRNVPKRTLLGSSEVNGFGLFAGEMIKRHEFIAEYRGEIISSEESNRRGAVYDWRPANYLFKLNKNQDIDATHAGNKTRFINNSSNDLNKNCEPALLLCNTVTRIGIYALREIKPGEELFFNYGYPASKMEKFLEKSQQNGNTVLVKAKAPRTSVQGQRMRRKANAESGTLSGDKQLAKSRSRKDGAGENGLEDVSMSENEDEDEYAEEAAAEAVAEDMMRRLAEMDGSSDDDYEDEAAWQSSSSISDGESASASRARRNLRSRKRPSASEEAEERAKKVTRTV